MINLRTLLSTFDEKGTLLKWLKKVESALANASLETVQVVVVDATHIKMKFVFADGTSVESPSITLPRGPQGAQGETGAKGDTGATGATPNISVTATQLPSGAQPTATRSGTDENPIITFGIPSGGGGTMLYMHNIENINRNFEFTIFSSSNSEYYNASLSEYIKYHGNYINVPGFFKSDVKIYQITYITTTNEDVTIYYSTEEGESSYQVFDTDIIVDTVTPL